MRLLEIRQKEVINIRTCASLGCVMDLLIDEKNGCILALIIPGPGKFCSVLGRDTEYIIPWEQVCQIGRDIILVDIDEKECRKKCESITLHPLENECRRSFLPSPESS